MLLNSQNNGRYAAQETETGVESKARTPRAPKTALDREVFIEAALRLASRSNTLTLSYRDLGRELGVDPTAIYRHFQNKEMLMSELFDRILTMTRERTTIPPAQWEECLVQLAEKTLDVFLEYPAIGVTATSITTCGPGEMDCIELMLECFSEAGLSGQDLAEQYAIFGSYSLSGAAGLARDQAESLEASAPEWFLGQLPADPARHPLAADLRNDIMVLNHRDMFLDGLRQIMQAAKQKAALQKI